MKLFFTIPLLLCYTVCYARQAGFITPDTICVNTPVTVNNTSVAGSKFYWSFCGSNNFSLPQATNLGGMGGVFSIPVFSETVKDGNNYYTFVVNNGSGGLVRLSYGNSLLNTPVVQDFGSFGGVIHGTAEGIQVVKDAVGWRVIIVGGNDPNPANVYIVKVDFGNSLDNMLPVAVNWGNIGTLSYPTDLYIFRENNAYYGFTVNAQSNTITRFSFGADFNSPPAAANLGNLGGLDWPTGVYAIKVVNEWHVFVCNTNSNTITRFDFGTSLLNVPTAVNLGNPDNKLNHPRDLMIINDCGNLIGLMANGDGDDILKLSFDGNAITGAISATSYGNIGNLNYPHSLSSLIREGDDLYTTVTNAFNGTITRIKFSGCTNGSIPSSLLQQPPVFTYTTPGTYNVKMMMDEGLATQESVCRDIVVMPPLTADLGPDVKICNGASVTLDAGVDDTRYVWSDNSTAQQLVVNTSGHYQVTKFNGGCTATDDVDVIISSSMSLTATNAAYVCGDLTGKLSAVITGGTGPYEYFLNAVAVGSTNTFDQLVPGIYTIDVTDAAGCKATTQADINLDAVIPISGSVSSVPPSCYGKEDGTITLSIQQGAAPIEYAIKGQPFQPDPVFPDISTGTYTLYARNAACIDSFEVTLSASAVTLNTIAKDATCDHADGQLDIDASGGIPPYQFYSNGTLVAGSMNNLSPGDYIITAIDSKGCSSTSNLTTINNITVPRISILNKDTTINIGQMVHLQAINGVDYEWTPADGLSCTTCATPVAQPLEPTTYIVKTITGNNCIVADTVRIGLSHSQYLYIPSAFTPNHDGMNDYFKVKSFGIDRFRMNIYNRWGELIYSSNNPESGWDGRFKDILQASGTYVYMIEYVYYGQDDKPLLQKGVLTLVN
ncbi:gliding motility-associated C-terminal domain-containing protein [Chitinophaga sp. YR573]|uniref:T9SS type B sorting domain-containing protein n=1 Tax=Chitinophaga sp. YR573 TaxID=1881040 RepID=UPI0008CA7ABE|nr:gliding motility-associated C-terminal domain-containing protein [Chitinophaga sp. YR573]SEW46174.1 gliding motility-associated C-terminal domain-containing protein [Chitinophaga sp. YR573]